MIVYNHIHNLPTQNEQIGKIITQLNVATNGLAKMSVELYDLIERVIKLKCNVDGLETVSIEKSYALHMLTTKHIKLEHRVVALEDLHFM